MFLILAYEAKIITVCVKPRKAAKFAKVSLRSINRNVETCRRHEPRSQRPSGLRGCRIAFAVSLSATAQRKQGISSKSLRASRFRAENTFINKAS